MLGLTRTSPDGGWFNLFSCLSAAENLGWNGWNVTYENSCDYEFSFSGANEVLEEYWEDVREAVWRKDMWRNHKIGRRGQDKIILEELQRANFSNETVYNGSKTIAQFGSKHFTGADFANFKGSVRKLDFEVRDVALDVLTESYDLVAGLRRSHLKGPIYVERMMSPAPDPGGVWNATNQRSAPEFRFFMFGKRIAYVSVELYAKSPAYCELNVDADFVPLSVQASTLRNDKTGKDMAAEKESAHRYCTKVFPGGKIPRPPLWAELVGNATLLGAAIGVHYRVDLFLTSEYGVILSEFTPFPAGGHHHGMIRRRPDGTIDSCEMGKMWNDSDDPIEGGTGLDRLQVPDVLKPFWKPYPGPGHEKKTVRLSNGTLLPRLGPDIWMQYEYFYSGSAFQAEASCDYVSNTIAQDSDGSRAHDGDLAQMNVKKGGSKDEFGEFAAELTWGGIIHTL